MTRERGSDWVGWMRRGVWVGVTVMAVGAIWLGVTVGWDIGADKTERSRKEQAMGVAVAPRPAAARPPLDEEQWAGVQTATFALG
jgi:hypothetical protein